VKIESDGYQKNNPTNTGTYLDYMIDVRRFLLVNNPKSFQLENPNKLFMAMFGT
jgi:hypothetical protein